MKTFCVISNRDKDVNLNHANHVKKYLESRGCACYIDSGDYGDIPVIREETEGVLVLGGDGTMLKAARDLAGYGLPLLGINLGTVGYLTEVEIGSMENALDRVIRDEYHIEERMMLEGRAKGTAMALNDIVVSRTGPLQMMSYNVYVNGQFLNGYQADGIIVSTPTGSTGYNMSAGGPVVEPTASILVVTPICPHTLNTRSIILSPADEIRIEVPEGRMGMKQMLLAYFDGGSDMVLETGDSLTIVRSKRTTKIMRLSQISFLETLHKKLQ
ncbi:MAG: NAD(+)/NADH kinase [Lachnospiraceae bacterium]|nr:NAD(+)/NADH kinase [Lachnospiraceae bacterium]